MWRWACLRTLVLTLAVGLFLVGCEGVSSDAHVACADRGLEPDSPAYEECVRSVELAQLKREMAVRNAFGGQLSPSALGASRSQIFLPSSGVR